MDRFENRRYVILSIFVVIALVFLFRLFYIQVINDTYKDSAENQALFKDIQYPARGIIYDRNGKILVYNEVAYDLMVIPRQVSDEIDTLAFCDLISIEKEDFQEKMKTSKKFSNYKASVFEKLIPADQWSVISERLYEYPGFFVQKRTVRRYPKRVASNVLGFIGEVGRKDLEQDPSYVMGDYKGVKGLERSYEQELRGKRGIKVYLRDVHNRIKGSYRDGILDTAAVPGKDLISTIDRDLQEYGEQLMVNKKGSIVAIEPSTGEILAMISAPSYDPNLLVGRDRTTNYSMLLKNDSLNPLFNRAINASYRPGSIFKLVQSLVGLQNKVITPQTRFVCNRGIIACHGSHTKDDLKGAIQHSCNPYYWNVYKRLIQRGKKKNIFEDSALGLRDWRKYVLSFGLGTKLKTDISGVNKGFVPDVKFYNKWYGEKRWAFSTIYSNSIGEGELGVVPLQMANLASILANRGHYYIPHLIKKVGSEEKREIFRERQFTLIDSNYFQTVLDALQAVVDEPGGTARRAKIDSIVVCGKTGTVQNTDSPDHSVFMAFAPRENPKIAIAVYVEDAGFGGTWAAPISSLMIEKYINREIKQKAKETRILEADFIHNTEDAEGESH